MTEYRRLCNNIWPIFYTIKITKARIFTISPKIVENCRDTVYCIINQLYNLKYILSWYRLSYNICIYILAGYKLDTPPPSIKVEIDCIDKTRDVYTSLIKHAPRGNHLVYQCKHNEIQVNPARGPCNKEISSFWLINGQFYTTAAGYQEWTLYKTAVYTERLRAADWFINDSSLKMTSHSWQIHWTGDYKNVSKSIPMWLYLTELTWATSNQM